MSNTPDSKDEFARVQDVLKAVSEFCDTTQPFVGERFKKQLRNTIRAVPRASVAAVAGDAHPIIDVAEQHDFIQIKNSDRCGLRGCVLGVLEHARIPSWPAAASSPAPASPKFVSEVDQWKHDLTTAGWVAETALNWRAPDGSLWRGPAGAWKELQRRNAPAPAQPEGEQEEKEFQRLRREFELSGLGDRPQSMSAAKLRRLIQLERLDATIRATDPVLTPEETDLIIGAIPLQALPVATPPDTPSDAAMRAAEELSRALIDNKFPEDNVEKIAAIITRHLVASPDAGDTETAREIVKRFGIKSGMFQGPRTLNAVEAVALAIASARQDENKACVEKVKARALDYKQARDDAYEGEPRCDAVGENEIRQAVAVELATILESAKNVAATTSPETAAQRFNAASQVKVRPIARRKAVRRHA